MGLGVASSLLAITVGLALSQPQVAARITTGSGPCESAAAAGAVWVANDGGGTLARIDPRSNRVTARIRVGRGSCAVAAGGGAVWVANYRTGQLLRVDTRTRAVRRVAVGGAPFDVIVDAGSVWVTGFENGALVEVDARTARVTRRIEIGGAPNGLLAAGGAIWVGLGRGATQVVRVDPVSGTAQRIDVGVEAPTHFVATSAGILVANDGDALVLLDPRDGRVLRVTHVGRTLGQAALAADGTVWVPDKEIDTIFRVDPTTGALLDSFPGGDGAFQALRAFGSMWVTSYAGADVWRFRS
jgi:DNA-binding beta-propeller fold protein YncE